MDKQGNKDFKGWIKVKEKTHNDQSQRSFKTGDIWWCKIGENVGSEINTSVYRLTYKMGMVMDSDLYIIVSNLIDLIKITPNKS